MRRAHPKGPRHEKTKKYAREPRRGVGFGVHVSACPGKLRKLEDEEVNHMHIIVNGGGGVCY